jgi:hypothetical protein
MARRSSGDPDVAQKRFGDQGIERPTSGRRAALEHAHGRNQRVAEVLCYLGLMRAAGTISATSGLVKVKKAEFQNYHGPAGTQAAHYLPGQLYIGPRLVSAYIKDDGTRVRLDGLFGDVQTLHPDVNKADSQAERDGLCDAFAAASDAVIRASTPPAAGRIDRSTLQDAYAKIWVPRARAAFLRAMGRKGEKYTMPSVRYGAPGTADYRTIVNLEDRVPKSEYERATDEQQDILRWYIEGLEMSPRALSAANVFELERSFRP